MYVEHRKYRHIFVHKQLYLIKKLIPQNLTYILSILSWYAVFLSFLMIKNIASMYYTNKIIKKRTEKDKRSVSMFTMAYNLQEEGKIEEAIEAYWESIRLIDTDMRSTLAFLRLYMIYNEKNDFENMKRTLELGIEYSDYFNKKEANELIEAFPEYKDNILLSLETNENLYPAPYWDKYNPLWRPNDTIFLIDLLENVKKRCNENI